MAMPIRIKNRSEMVLDLKSRQRKLCMARSPILSWRQRMVPVIKQCLKHPGEWQFVMFILGKTVINQNFVCRV